MTFSQCGFSVSQNCAFLLILSLKGGSWHLPALLCPFLNTVGEQRVLWLWIYGHLFSVIWLFIAAFSGTLTQEAPPSRLSSALKIKILVFEYQSASALADSKLPCLKVLCVSSANIIKCLKHNSLAASLSVSISIMHWDTDYKAKYGCTFNM